MILIKVDQFGFHVSKNRKFDIIDLYFAANQKTILTSIYEPLYTRNGDTANLKSTMLK